MTTTTCAPGLARSWVATGLALTDEAVAVFEQMGLTADDVLAIAADLRANSGGFWPCDPDDAEEVSDDLIHEGHFALAARHKSGSARLPSRDG